MGTCKTFSRVNINQAVRRPLKVRIVSLAVVLTMTFMASLPAICATLCTFKACPQMAAAAAPKGHSCCHETGSPKAPVSKCKIEMNKEAPPTRVAEPVTFSFEFDVIDLPVQVVVAIETDVPCREDAYPAPRDHSPPAAVRSALGPRAPPINA